MKTCPKCKATGIPDDATFCPSCGQPIISTPNPWEENRQKQLQKANADLIEMKSKLIAFESERRKFFAELMQSDSYMDDVQVNTKIIKNNRKKEWDFYEADKKHAMVGAVLFNLILIVYLVIAIINCYKDYQALGIVGINLSVIFEYVFEIVWKGLGGLLVYGVLFLIIFLIMKSKYRKDPLVGNNTILELQKFIEKYRELYSYMNVTLEDEIIDAEQNSKKILDKLNDIDNKLNRKE